MKNSKEIATRASVPALDITVLETLPLRTTDASWQLAILTPDYLDAVNALHETVRASLPPEQKSFILPRTRAYFEKHFKKESGNLTLGALKDGDLIAKGVIMHPDAQTQPEELAGSVAPRDVPPEQTSILQAVTVHPDYRNNGIMQVMIRHWLRHAQAHGKTHALAEIEVRNAPSWHAFLKAGLHIVSLGASPIDGAQIYSAHEWVPPEKEKQRVKYALRTGFDPVIADDTGEVLRCAPDDLPRQKQYLADGFVVTGADADGRLILRRP